jgi:hypothetical protein
VPVVQALDPLLEVTVLQAFAPSHPQQGALYYRIRDLEDNSSVACVWDIESHIGGDVRVINFVKHVDLLIHDTQYLEEEYSSVTNPVQGFGHSTYDMAIENARKAHVKYLAAFHYNPRHSDDILDEVKARYTAELTDISFIMPYEGLSLTLSKGVITEQSNIVEGFAKVSV